PRTCDGWEVRMSPERAPTEVAPRHEQASFLSLAETVSSLIALVQDGELIYINPAGCALLGRSKQELLGRGYCELLHPDDRAEALEREAARLAGEPRDKRATDRFVHADGRTLWLECSLDVVDLEGRPTTLVTGHDVS